MREVGCERLEIGREIVREEKKGARNSGGRG